MTDGDPHPNADQAAPTKVDITVAGHTILVEAAEPLDVVAGKALALFHATSADARRIPLGFAVSSAYTELGGLNGHIPEWEPPDERVTG